MEKARVTKTMILEFIRANGPVTTLKIAKHFGIRLNRGANGWSKTPARFYDRVMELRYRPDIDAESGRTLDDSVLSVS